VQIARDQRGKVRRTVVYSHVGCIRKERIRICCNKNVIDLLLIAVDVCPPIQRSRVQYFLVNYYTLPLAVEFTFIYYYVIQRGEEEKSVARVPNDIRMLYDCVPTVHKYCMYTSILPTPYCVYYRYSI
jgi:hypothetical protein